MSKFMFAVLVCLLLSGGPVRAQNAAPDFRTAAGCGPAETQFSAKMGTERGGITAPSAGKALMYVIEVQSPWDTGITTRVGLDGKWVGGSSGGAFLGFEVEPGEHHVCVDWQSSVESRRRLGGAAVLRAEAGRVYYFVSNVIIGHVEDLTLTEVDEAEGMWLLSKTEKSDWKAA